MGDHMDGDLTWAIITSALGDLVSLWKVIGMGQKASR